MLNKKNVVVEQKKVNIFLSVRSRVRSDCQVLRTNMFVSKVDE